MRSLRLIGEGVEKGSRYEGKNGAYITFSGGENNPVRSGKRRG